MCGWVKLNRDVIEVDLWKEVVPLRLYLLLLTQATREDGWMVNGFPLKRGQYIRAYSKLVEDLGYREGRGEKQYSKSTIKRTVDKLVKKGLITVEETNMGMLFTLLNCDEIQAKGFVEFFCPSFRGTIAERMGNDGGTIAELNQEREKKEEKVEKNDDDVREQDKSMPENSEEMTRRMDAITERFIQLRNRGAALSAKDMLSIEKVAMLKVPLEKLLGWMEEIHTTYRQKSPLQTINSMAYYESAILTIMGKIKNKKRQKETLQDRIARLEWQGKLG